MKNIIAIIGLVSLSLSLMAGSPVLEGKVTDQATGESLTGVKIIIEGSDAQVITDFDGYFTLSELPEGELTVKLSYLSYETKEVKLEKDSKGFLDLKMESVGAYRTSGYTASNE